MPNPLQSRFETATWLGALLAGSPKTGVPATWFRKDFHLSAPPHRALLRATGLGLYECEINGQPVGDSVLAPGWTDYSKRLYFQEYDVTRLLRPGANALGVVLGDGWYCGHIAHMDRQFYGLKPQFILEMILETEEGHATRVASGPGWRATTGPLLQNDLILGEDYDARLEMPGWSSPGFDESAWQAAPGAEAPNVVLEKSPAPPVRRQEVFTPVDPDSLNPRQRSRGWFCLLDFGQNLSGRLRLTVRGQRGTCLTLRHGEMLDEKGALYTGNLRSARATDFYTLRGGDQETWEPRFTFHGFRYAEISWYQGEEVVIEKVEATALYSDMKPIGSFQCSHSMLNRLAENIHWGLRGNFLDIPTDCPQRDERLGWTGDAQVFIRTAALHRDVLGFFRKWLQDLRDAQRPNGAIPRFVPDARCFTEREDGGPAWSDAVYICPWVLYEQYGEAEVLAENFDGMRCHFDYLTRHRVKEFIREHPGIEGWHGYGDWLALDGSGTNVGATPQDLIGTAYYAEAARILKQTASVLGRENDAKDYAALHRQIVDAFRHRFLTPEGFVAGDTQTAYALALHFDLVPEKLRLRAGEELARMVRSNGNRLNTGFVGTPCLLHALEATGHLEVAYALLEQEECPSWLFCVKQGATTIWERWNSWTPEHGFHPAGMNSFNHYAYGAVGEWMFRTVAGINPAAPGYARILFKPRPGGSLASASAQLLTPRGEAAIAWELDDNQLKLQITVPDNSEAELSLPEGWRSPHPELKPGRNEIVATRNQADCPK